MRAALAALLVTAAASAAANVLVVRSSGPSARTYPPGKSLPDNAAIALQGGDTLVVLDARGTRTFRGPGRFNPSVAAQASARGAVQNNARPQIGAVRSAAFVPGNDANIWQLDVDQSGTHCLADQAPPTLWRADGSSAGGVTIAAADGTRREIAWPAGEQTLAWPAGLPVTEGAEYSLSRPGVAVPSRISFRRIDSAPSEVSGVAAALIEAECQAQLDLLVDSLAQN
jgi:hypothetical protein